MAVSARMQILEALRDHLDQYPWRTFVPAVYLGRSIFDPDDDPLPVLTIMPGQETAESVYQGSLVTLSVDVSILLSLQDGQEVLSVCEPVLSEIKTALFAQSITVSTELFPLTYIGGGITDYPSELGPFIATIGVQAQVQYTTDHQED